MQISGQNHRSGRKERTVTFSWSCGVFFLPLAREIRWRGSAPRWRRATSDDHIGLWTSRGVRKRLIWPLKTSLIYQMQQDRELLFPFSLKIRLDKYHCGKKMLLMMESKTWMLYKEECELFAKVRWQDFSTALQWDEGHVRRSERGSNEWIY